MPEKLTTETFIAKARAVHGDRYDYSKVEYVRAQELVTIICSKHGEFRQQATVHLSNHGCKLCAIENNPNSKPRSNEAFIVKAEALHGKKYNYDKVNYIRAHTPVVITCTKHGDFKQRPADHLTGKGCPKCGAEKVGGKLRLDKAEILKRFAAAHGNKYDYSRMEFKGVTKKIEIVCTSHKEIFFQSPYSHYTGQTGCSKCLLLKMGRKPKSTLEEVIQTLSEVHNNKYTYPEQPVPGAKDRMRIVCSVPGHGEFIQTYDAHRNGNGCPKCCAVGRSERRSLNQEIFEKRAREVHGSRYDYSSASYESINCKLPIVCSKHGEFKQTPGAHLSGQGCPVCGARESKRERDINKFLSNYFETENRKRGILSNSRQELDIYIQEKNFAIEFNGSIWHSEKYHKDPIWHMRKKQLECEEKGIRLIHASEYQDQTVIKKTLAMILGINDESYYARKCKVELGRSSDPAIKKFLNKNHLQGEVSGCEADYLTLNGQIVAVMAFSKASSERGNKDATRWELRRYSSVCRIVGGASRLLKQFIRRHPECTCIISYSDNAWFTGNMYEKLGFKFVKDVAPNYKYTQRQDIVKTKSSFQRRHLAKMEGFDFRPEETEHENCLRNGWYRLYDCGKRKWQMDILAD
jgi:hypothetical protein